jgi:hypothetical protein
MPPDDESPPPQIPRDLYSEYEERPFAHCTRCGESLSDDESGFQISKAYKRGECVMEYALCDHCRVAMMEEFSQESKKRLGEFQDDHVHLNRGLDSCSVCGASRLGGTMEDFVVTGLCEGTSLLHSIMVCGKCGDDIQGIISKKTRDTWRRFVDENFPGPPSEGEIPEFDTVPSRPFSLISGSKM